MDNNIERGQEIRPAGGFTVLMAVYHKDSPELFRNALESVFLNSLAPNAVLVVADGPLTPQLDDVLSDFGSREPTLGVVRLPANLGLANALNEGLKHVETEWVARADSDDRNHEDRFAKQAAALLAAGEELDIIGSAIREIDQDGTQLAVRRTVSGHDAIISYATRRSPFNHMTVWYRAAFAQKVGGYPDIFLKEDYGLWASMIQAGARCENLSDITVDAMTGREMYKRRGGLKYAIAEVKLQKHLAKCNVKPNYIAIIDGFVRASIFLMPASFRSVVYRRVLRSDLSRVKRPVT
ncbi:glycosyltransferase [Martelella limonii]|uniref:glycosyltransferase n=1 Tax=Martelella limonii TaxID=1647649 RepID=UPI00158128F6|nr:glycosyltransferase [Martelella limonii]